LVAPLTLTSIAQTESGFQALTIHDNTTRTTGTPATPDVAVQIATRLLEAGHSVDLGIMQINSANFAKLGMTVESAFDPCKSISAAAAILSGSYAGGDTHTAQQAALRVAVSEYNTGDAARGFANGYVHKVELAAQHVVPALDVGGLANTADTRSRASPPPTPTATADPNAPPAWDVWSSFDYAAAHDRGDEARQTQSARTASGRSETRTQDQPRVSHQPVLKMKGNA
jgi:type IV secretion system protein VirB1